MDRQEFINRIKDYAIQTQKDYNILTSLTLAQAILESNSGTSELAIKGNALFGIKWIEGCGYDKYLKSTQEYENSKEITIQAYFRKYNSWEESIIDHAKFLQKDRYKNLHGVTDYKQICELIYKDEYATDINYTDKLINVIEEYKLYQYDIENINNKGDGHMKFAIDPGHGCYPDTGAEGYLNEQNCALDVANNVISKLQSLGHTAWCARPSSASSVTDSLQQRCDSANSADYLVSIHLNASNGEGHGTEVFAMSEAGRKLAQRIVDNLASLGWSNRGVKDGSNLYVIHHSNPVAVLVEICFCDNQDDCNLFNNLGTDIIANAIVKGITGQTITSSSTQFTSTVSSSPRLLMLQNPLLYGDDILNYQKQLNQLGYSVDKDGYFGDQCYNATCQVQTKLGLDVDGIVGSQTLNGVASAISELSKQSIKSNKKGTIICYNNKYDKRAADYLCDYLGCEMIDNSTTKYDYSNILNVYCVGGGEFTSYCTKLLKGTDRYETCQKVLDFIKNNK